MNNRPVLNQSGGVIIDMLKFQSSENALSKFINNCEKITILDIGSNAGKIAILEYPDNQPSPFTKYSATTFINPVFGNINKIILKFCLISSDLENLPDKETSLHLARSGDEILVVSGSKFLQEIGVQQYISLTTANDDPVNKYHMATPYIIYKYDGINDTDNLLPIITSTFFEDDDDDDGEYYHWDSFKQLLGDQYDKNGNKITVKLGVIAMTMATSDEYKIQSFNYHYYTPDILLLNRIPVIYELLRVAVFCQYIHDDFHSGNYFIEEIPDNITIGRQVVNIDDERVKYLNINTTGNIKWWKLKATIIDWGRFVIWKDEDINDLKKKWNSSAENTELNITINFFKMLIKKITDLSTIEEFTKYTILHTDNDSSKIATYLAQYHKLCYFASIDNINNILKMGPVPPPLIDYINISLKPSKILNLKNSRSTSYNLRPPRKNNSYRYKPYGGSNRIGNKLKKRKYKSKKQMNKQKKTKKYRRKLKSKRNKKNKKTKKYKRKQKKQKTKKTKNKKNNKLI